MFQLKNEKLEELIRSCISLNESLTGDQIEKFVKKAFSLGKERQEELVKMLEDENAYFEKLKGDRIEAIKKYNEDVKTFLHNFRKETVNASEAIHREDNERKLEEMLRDV